MKEIKLTNGGIALVDDEDYERVMKYNWHKIGRYAKCGVKPQKYLHRFILGISGDIEIDHINGDGLDCRKENIRLATRSQNGANMRIRVGFSSTYKGVSAYRKRWRAFIGINYNTMYLGTFDTEVEAAIVYDNAAKEIFGEFARTNF